MDSILLLFGLGTLLFFAYGAYLVLSEHSDPHTLHDESLAHIKEAY